MRKLKTGGRAAVVIKNTALSNTDNASIALRKELLQSCNLHATHCPHGTFQKAGEKMGVLRQGALNERHLVPVNLRSLGKQSFKR